MDVLSDLEAKTDPGENSEQLAFFDLEVANGKADLEPEVTGNDPPQPEDSSCTFCGQRLDTDDDTTYKEVRTWISGPKKDSAVLRQYTGRYAHGDCIAKLRAGISPSQQDLETLLDGPAVSGDVGDILTDRSDSYKLGYADGLSGATPLVPGVGEYEEGFKDGEEERDPFNNQGIQHSGWDSGRGGFPQEWTLTPERDSGNVDDLPI